jgi:hypothetical protein
MVLAALLLSARFCRANGALLSADDDDVVVHNLAHLGAGTLVAIVPDFILTRFPQDSWEQAWYSRLAIDCATAAVVTELYEWETNKDTPTSLEHDAYGALGAAILVGASVHW